MNSNIRLLAQLYLPIILVEVYLVFTILLFLFGPVDFKIHNELLFWLYLSLYQFSLFLGYYVSLRLKKIRSGINSFLSNYQYKNHTYLSLRFFYIALVLSLASTLIFYKNVMLVDDIFSHDFFKAFVSGLSDPNLSYSSRIARLDGYEGNKLVNALYFFIAFSRLMFLVMLPFFWGRLSVLLKIISLSLAFLQIFVSYSAGLNKPIFDLFFFFSSSLILVIVFDYIKAGGILTKEKVFFVACGVLSFFIFIVSFGYFIYAREGADFSFIVGSSPLGDIEVKEINDINSVPGLLNYILVWISYYLVQGYYGFSLSLGYEFDSVFGFGNSPFLLRQLEFVLGEPLSHLTYQQKISNVWDGEAQWHSFYAHMANDVHFIGVAFVMFLLGFYLARVWLSALDDNIYAKLLIPLIALIFLFIPANNQVFGYLETLSYFLIVNVFWLLSSVQSNFCRRLRGF